MARFEVKTPEQFYTGRVVGILFDKGRTVVTSDTAEGLAALYYFKTQGYGIAPLDQVGIDEVLTRANEDATSEFDRLSRENAELENRLKLDELREENKRLQEQVFKADSAATELSEPAEESELLAPPAESAPVSAWRAWAVESGRATEDEVKSQDKATIISTHGAAYDRERAARLQKEAGA